MYFRKIFASVLLTAALAGCSSTRDKEGTLRTAYFPTSGPHRPASAHDRVPMEPAAWVHADNVFGSLAGRTLTVGSLSDLRLQPKEVVLTFDDGPMPGKTERILDTLDRFGVKATFLMVGQMAKAHPQIARMVAERGHAIGSHTYRHADLARLGFDQAVAEISNGEAAVRRASGTDVGFFRFPYLSSTSALRSALARRGTVVLDADVDSKDYFKSTPDAVAARTVAALNRRHSGIILMHDIHGRTATMLPALLQQLKAEGYKVVTLRYRRSRMEMIASAD